MHTAQKNLLELSHKIPAEAVKDREFIHKCMKAWDGYDSMQYSYPHFQLEALEKEYGTTVAEIREKYSEKHLPKCPRCGGKIEGYPALSRRDNETDICSSCGEEEAMVDFRRSFDRDIPVDAMERESAFADWREGCNVEGCKEKDLTNTGGNILLCGKHLKESECEHCGGAGVYNEDEDDGEGHTMRGVGKEVECICQLKK